MRISDWSSDVCSSDLVLTKATTQTITDARSQPRTRPGEPPSTSDASSRYHHPVRRTLSASVLCAPDQRSPGTRVRTASTLRSEEHTSELQSLMRISYAVCCMKKTNNTTHKNTS